MKNSTRTPIDDHEIEFLADGKKLAFKRGLLIVRQSIETEINENSSRFPPINDQRRAETDRKTTFYCGFVTWFPDQ